MPKPRKEENPDALGQIFDFIFKEAEKPPDKRRPVKVTGISGQNELTDALAAALEKPGLFMSDQILDVFNEALDLEVARIKANEQGSATVKFSANNLISMLDDPNAFIEKGFTSAKTFRKQMRAQYLGKTMQHFVAEGWAKKYNLDLDAQEAIRGYFGARHLDKTLPKEERAKSYDASNAIGASVEGRFFRGFPGSGELNLTSEKEHLTNRAFELLGRQYFGASNWQQLSDDQKRSFEKVHIDWSTMSNADKKKFMAANNGMDAVEKYITSNFNPTTANSLFNNYRNARASLELAKKEDTFDVLNRDRYLDLEVKNLDDRITQLRQYMDTHDLSEREIINLQVGIQRLEQAKVIFGGQLLNPENIHVAQKKIDSSIDSFKLQMNQARAQGDMDSVKLYRQQIKDLRAGKRELNSVMLWGRVGQIEGYINSLNGIYKDGNFIKSYLDGSFFDPNRNYLFRPTADRDVKFSFGEKNGEIGIHVAAPTKNALLKTYNNTLTNLYYLTPKSIMKSLFVNGEGFVYLAYMKKLGLEGSLKDILHNKKFEISIEDLLSTGNAQTYLNNILSGTNRQLTQQEIEKYTKELKALMRRSQTAKIFSFTQRTRDKVRKFFDDKIFKKMRQKIYDKLMAQKAFQVAEEVLGQWLAKGGIQVFVKGLVIAAANAVGIATTGGLANFAITIVTSLLVDVMYGIIKVLAMIVIFAFVGIFALAFMLGSKSTYKHALNSYAYTTVVPGEVVTNPNFRGLYPIDDGEIPGELHPFSGGSLPDGVQCLIGTGGFRCSQGPFSSYSHSKVAAIDITDGVRTFYAPTFCDGSNCVVKTVAEVNCTRCDIPSMPGCHQFPAGGMVIFDATYGSTTYTFKLIHVYKDVSVGQKLSSGEAVADIIQAGPDHERIEKCSSGPHLHLEVKANGSSVNPMDVMTGPTSSGGFACNISACPVN